MDSAVLDRECILRKTIENVIGDDDERSIGFSRIFLSSLKNFKFQNAGADKFLQVSILTPLCNQAFGGIRHAIAHKVQRYVVVPQ